MDAYFATRICAYIMFILSYINLYQWENNIKS